MVDVVGGRYRSGRSRVESKLKNRQSQIKGDGSRGAKSGVVHCEAIFVVS